MRYYFISEPYPLHSIVRVFYFWNEEKNEPVEEIGMIYTVYHEDFATLGHRYNVRYPDASFDNMVQHREIKYMYLNTAPIYKLLYE